VAYYLSAEIRRIFTCPIAEIPSRLIEKYRNYPASNAEGTIFPPVSNQEVNRCLKIIQAACNISKKFTFHTGRHMFGTTITLKNRVPITSVKQMMVMPSFQRLKGILQLTRNC
jgi:integrase